MSIRPSENPLRQVKPVQENRGGAFADLRRLPDEFYRRVMAPLARIAEQMGLPRDECEDMVQEAWMRAFEHGEQFLGEHTLTETYSWLAVIVHNAAVNTKRSLDRHPTLALEDTAREPMDRKEVERVGEAERSEQLAPLLARLQRQNPEKWRLVCARYLYGQKVRDMAAATGRMPREISDRIHRGLQRMRYWATKACPCDKDAP